MIAWGSTTDRILLLLATENLTKAEICRRLELTHDQVASVLSRLHKKTKRISKRIYIAGYTRHTISGRTYIRAVYALGDKRDVRKKPEPYTYEERHQRYYKKLISLRNSSIFHQTLSRRELESQRRQRD